MKSRKVITAIITLACSITWIQRGHAQQCPPSNVAGFSGNNEIIWVYLEVDFDDELSECNNKNIPPYTDDDSGFYSSSIKNILLKSMNVWNTQARGPELRYGGMVSSLYDTPGLACTNQMPNRPAVFVNYNPSCKPGSGPDGCGASAIATVGSINECSDAVHLTFWGNNNGTYEPAGTTCSNYLDCAYDSDCDDANCNDGECLCSDVPATSGTCEIFGGTCMKDSDCPTYLYCYGDNNQCRCSQTNEYCESDRGLNWLTNSQRNNPRDPANDPQYSLYTVLNHELGHVLGVGHTIHTSQVPLPEGAAMRGGGSPHVFWTSIARILAAATMGTIKSVRVLRPARPVSTK